MSQDNPEAGDVFVYSPKGGGISLVYLLVSSDDPFCKLQALWFTQSGYPTIRPQSRYPDYGDTFLCNISKLFRSLEEKLVHAATDH